jgi:cobalt transporter subunit CbtB
MLMILYIGWIILELKYIHLNLTLMSQSKEIVISKSSVPKIAIIALAVIFVLGMFVVGFDQGHIFSVVFGEQAFDEMYIHELTHDMRHAAGFPCH